ncbi:MAG: hypothetical protein ABUT20_52675 [Bacteroidota bacterium]
MKKRARNIFLIVLLLALTGAGIGYYLFNKGPVNVQGSNAINIIAGDLYQAYISDSSAAQKKYTDKILLVSGEVHDISSNLQKKKIILLKGNTDGAYINCTMEENIENIHVTDKVNIQGICSGIGEGDADLGIKGDVYLTRCYLVK